MNETAYATLKIPSVYRRVAGVGLLLVLVAGCTSYHGVAHIQSNPAGAQVYDMDDSTVLGITPVKVWWREPEEGRKFVNIRVHKEGYSDKTTSFWMSLRHTSKQDAESEPQNVNIELEKE